MFTANGTVVAAPVTDTRYILFKILAPQIKIFLMQREYHCID